MLQHNIGSLAQRSRTRAHLAHAAVVGVHALCCGLPILALLAAGLTGMTSGVAMFSGAVGALHDVIHTFEAWILLISALLVGIGGALELFARRGPGAVRGVPWLFLLSAACFAMNTVIVLLHRG